MTKKILVAALVGTLGLVGCGGGSGGIDGGAGGGSGGGVGGGSGGGSGGGAGGGTGGGVGGGAGGGVGGGSGGGAGGGAGGGVGGGAGGGAGGGGGSTDGGMCSPGCGTGRQCCAGVCVNTDNNPNHCGGCGIQCTGTTPYCDGTCQPLPCDAGSCSATPCCEPGYTGTQLCCKSEGPQSGPPTCFTPTGTDLTCPMGCAPLCVSDRNLKAQIAPADEQAVLEGVSRMPISSWVYGADANKVRHLGPMAQDFHAAFGLGAQAGSSADTTYDPIDAHGVALASIKALNTRIRELEAQNQKLEQRLKALEAKSGKR